MYIRLSYAGIWRAVEGTLVTARQKKFKKKIERKN
jgi:hypothetical protein